jgi:predicted DNA-binding transcriptional regulator AlpA
MSNFTRVATQRPAATPSKSTIPSSNVCLSKWVNEPLPPLNEILSSHEVARLTRRPRWVLATLTFLGKFPRAHRYRGRGIGWRQSEVLNWLLKGDPARALDDEHLPRAHGCSRAIPAAPCIATSKPRMRSTPPSVTPVTSTQSELLL